MLILTLISFFSCTANECVGSTCSTQGTTSLKFLSYSSQKNFSEPRLTLNNTEISGPGSYWSLHSPSSGVLYVGFPSLGEVDRLSIPELINFEERTADYFGDPDEYFGSSISTIAASPELFLIGAPHKNHDGYKEGSIYIYTEDEFFGEITGDQNNGRIGAELVSCGDLDQDGINDIIAPRSYWRLEQESSMVGEVRLLLSSLLVKPFTTRNINEFPVLSGSRANARFGYSVDCSSDVNEDGTPDILVGAPFTYGSAMATGAVYLYDGATLDLISQSYGTTKNSWRGWSVEVGAIDDGPPEIIVGSPGDNNGTGKVSIWKDGALNELPHLIIEGAQKGERFGSKIVLQDLNLDGDNNLLISSEKYDTADHDDAGALYALNIGDLMDQETFINSDTSTVFWGTHRNHMAGSRLHTADVNRNGYPEIMLLLDESNSWY